MQTRITCFNLLVSQFSPLNSGRQSQLYPPGMLVHLPLLWHGELTHLSTTVEQNGIYKNAFSLVLVNHFMGEGGVSC